MGLRLPPASLLLPATAWLLLSAAATGRAAGVSAATERCLGCHGHATPGIVSDWKASRHARTTPAEALLKPALERRFSAAAAPEGTADTVVGCAECHTRDAGKHPDTFAHNGFGVHIVVTPEDCAGCHPLEREQYAGNLMAAAHGNLEGNRVHRSMVDTVNGVQTYADGALAHTAPDALSDADSCLSCHGTRVEVGGLKPRQTALGEMTFPVLSGWPNQGVGRVNPDGSKGACTACHTRHGFSIEVARKPRTCSQCHKGPDVPAYAVYLVSKHGNLYESLESTWEFSAVPWSPGEHFSAPTCAACHVSLLAAGGGVIAERTHRMNDRIAWRIFGLVYAHPHPVSPDTTTFRNGAGLPLPTELTGEPAAAGLIGKDEQASREARMQRVCTACHSRQWTEGHYEKFARCVATTNAMTLAATRVMLDAWEQGLARGPAAGDSLFNEAIERRWVSQWLFYANSSRYASAMGGADYGVFANGRFQLSANLQELLNYVGFLKAARGE